MREEIQSEVGGGVGRIWLNRPEKRNAMTDAMIDEMGELIARFDADEDVRIIVFRGRGHTFSSGADLSAAVSTKLGSGTGFAETAQRAAVLTRLSDSPKPSLAVVEGYATAGGFELMLACDFAIMATDAQIADFHIRRALVPGGGPFYRLARAVGIRRAKWLMLSGRLIDAETALDWGLVNATAPPGALDGAVEAFVSDFTDKSPYATRLMKMVLNRSLDADTASLIAMESLAVGLAFGSEDCREGVAAFLEKREPVWTGR